MTCYELTAYETSQTYRDDNEKLFRGLGGMLDPVDGLLSFQHNVLVEDHSRGYIVVGYETLDQHEALMAKPQDFMPIRNIVVGQGFEQERFHMHHVEYDTEESEAILDSKVSQFIEFQLKDGATDTKVLDGPLEKLVKEVKGLKGCTGAVFGASFEDAGLVVAAIGWDSLEAMPKDLVQTYAPEAAKLADVKPFSVEFKRTNARGINVEKVPQ